MTLKNNKPISCIIVDDEVIAQEVLQIHLSQINNIKLIASCSSAMEAYYYIRHHKIDLVFLDINMPEISGISLAKSIDKHTKVIFTTAYREYALEGFELQAVDYLLKPITYERLLKSVSAYFEIYSNIHKDPPTKETSSNFIFVRSDRRMIKIEFDSIIYIESYSDYLKIHSKDLSTIITRETISSISSRLPQQDFIRVHRSYLVALNHIDSFTKERISIINKHIPISRSYRKQVNDILKKL